MTAYFTADTHFGHKKVAEIRGYDDPNEMSEILVRRWNSMVDSDDIVYHLGDVVLGGFENNKHYISQLNGYKILVAGNHDRCFYGLKNYQNKAQKYIDAGFDEVYYGEPIPCLFEGVGTATLSHFPREQDERHGEKYGEFLAPEGEYWLIHGHVHALWRVKNQQINVGVDVWDGFPVHSSTLSLIMLDKGYAGVMSEYTQWRKNETFRRT